MIGHYVTARVSYHALTADGDMPMTSNEQKKKPSDAKIAKAKEARKQHDREWLDALSDPKVFGKLMGMPHILGEPEQKPKVAPVTNIFEKFADRLDAALGEAG